MYDIQIQIVNYKYKKYLFECLESVSKDLAGVSFSYHIAVLDNASGDDLSDILTQFPSLKSVEVVQGVENKGFGAGNNLLAERANAEYLLLLNPDTKIIEPNTVVRMLEQIKSLHADVYGPRLIAEGNTTQWWDHGELYGFKAWIANLAASSHWEEQTKPVSAAWVSGAVFLLKKETYDSVGGFDENFFIYKEEEDLCYMLRKNGACIIYDPTVTIFHRGGVSARKEDHMQKSSAYFIEKHFRNRPSYYFAKFILWCKK